MMLHFFFFFSFKYLEFGQNNKGMGEKTCKKECTIVEANKSKKCKARKIFDGVFILHEQESPKKNNNNKH